MSQRKSYANVAATAILESDFEPNPRRKSSRGIKRRGRRTQNRRRFSRVLKDDVKFDFSECYFGGDEPETVDVSLFFYYDDDDWFGEDYSYHCFWHVCTDYPTNWQGSYYEDDDDDWDDYESSFDISECDGPDSWG